MHGKSADRPEMPDIMEDIGVEGEFSRDGLCAPPESVSDGDVLRLLAQLTPPGSGDAGSVAGPAEIRARSAAFTALCEKYRPLLTRMVNRYTADRAVSSDTVRAEMEQEAQIALYRAAMTYKTGHSTTFGLYAAVCIRNRLISYIRKEKRSMADTEAALSYPVPDTSADPGESIPARDMFRENFDRFLTSLTAYERKVFDLHIRGASYKEIAAALSDGGKTVGEKSVDNAVYRIRVKLKRQLGGS